MPVYKGANIKLHVYIVAGAQGMVTEVSFVQLWVKTTEAHLGRRHFLVNF